MSRPKGSKSSSLTPDEKRVIKNAKNRERYATDSAYRNKKLASNAAFRETPAGKAMIFRWNRKVTGKQFLEDIMTPAQWKEREEKENKIERLKKEILE